MKEFPVGFEEKDRKLFLDIYGGCESLHLP